MIFYYAEKPYSNFDPTHGFTFFLWRHQCGVKCCVGLVPEIIANNTALHNSLWCKSSSKFDGHVN